MNKISNVIIKPLQESIYMKPLTMQFMQNGKKRAWDLLAVHDSVAVIIFNITRNVLILVKQFRPPVYIGSIPEEDRQGEIDVKKYPAELGITIELCAGIVDKNLPLPEIAAEEIYEECGYKIDAKLLEQVACYRSGVGTMGSIQTLFYCEVTDDMRMHQGGGVEDEVIDVVEMNILDIKKYIAQEHILSPPSFLFGIYWFLHMKAKNPGETC